MIKRQYLFLLVLLVIAFLLRFPSLFEPNWYGDEGVYQVLGRVIRAGGLLYRDIWDNKPPLLYLIYAIINGDHFMARFVSLIFLLLSIPAFYLLAKELFKKAKSIFVSTALFAVLFSIPLLEGNIANAENFMLLPIILAALLIISLRNFQFSIFNFQFFLAGFLLSLAFLIKIVGVFDLVAFILFILFTYQWQKRKYRVLIKKFIITTWPIVIGFLLPVFGTVIFFLTKGAFVDFMTATFSQNVSYVGFGNRFLFGQGLLVFKLVFLTAFVVIVFWQRLHFTKTQIFIFLWLAFSLFNAFFAGRPYTHYLLVLLPSFSLLLGALFENKIHRLLNILIIIFVLSLIAGNFWIYGKTLFYYQNFLSFISGRKPLFSYQDFFAPHVERDYRLAQFLKGRILPADTIFIWGDNPQLYTLSDQLPPGRYTVAYHITFYPKAVSETKEALKRKKPKYIVVIKEISPYEELFRGYRLAFVVAGAQIYGKNTIFSQER